MSSLSSRALGTQVSCFKSCCGEFDGSPFGNVVSVSVAIMSLLDARAGGLKFRPAEKRKKPGTSDSSTSRLRSCTHQLTISSCSFCQLGSSSPGKGLLLRRAPYERPSVEPLGNNSLEGLLAAMGRLGAKSFQELCSALAMWSRLRATVMISSLKLPWKDWARSRQRYETVSRQSTKFRNLGCAVSLVCLAAWKRTDVTCSILCSTS